ncbi:hypothetical protein ES703_92861 [subsurface metagenome]
MVEIIKAASIPLAMVIVGLLTWAAIRSGIDGAIFMVGCTIVGGLGGYEIKNLVTKK